jgi:hypothetical protein
VRGRTVRTSKKRSAFLAALEAGSSVHGACLAAGLGRSAVYAWRDDDADFASQWDEAIESGTDRLEDEARRRAMQQSDVLLIFLLKARRPAIYREPRASAAVMSMTPEDIRAVEQARRIRDMTQEEIEEEIAGIERRRAIANAARAAAESVPPTRNVAVASDSL